MWFSISCQINPFQRRADLLIQKNKLNQPTAVAKTVLPAKWGWAEKTAHAVLSARGDRVKARQNVQSVFASWSKVDPAGLKKFLALHRQKKHFQKYRWVASAKISPSTDVVSSIAPPSSAPQASSRDIAPAKIFLKFPTHRLTVDDLKIRRDELEKKLRDFIRENFELSLVDYTVATGDTLQLISYNHYWTTRRWTEIYLLNSEKIPNWNTLDRGLKLSIVKHVDVNNQTNKNANNNKANSRTPASAAAPVSIPVAAPIVFTTGKPAVKSLKFQ